MKLRTVAAIAVACVLLSACSSAPKAKTQFYETRNKAAEFAKLGDGFMATAQYSQAAKYYDEALRTNSSVDNLEGVSASHASLGRVYLATGDLATAETEFGLSRRYALMAASPSSEAAAVAGLGELRYARGEKEGALSLFEEAIRLSAKDEPYLAIALHDAGVAKNSLDRVSEAIGDLEKAAAINTKLKRWTELAANRYVLASIQAAQGKTEAALATALLALAADKAAENGRGIAGDLAGCAKLAIRLDRNDEAWNYWLRSFDTAVAAGDVGATRRALAGLVALAATSGRADDQARYEALAKKLEEPKQEGQDGSQAPLAPPAAPAPPAN